MEDIDLVFFEKLGVGVDFSLYLPERVIRAQKAIGTLKLVGRPRKATFVVLFLAINAGECLFNKSILAETVDIVSLDETFVSENGLVCLQIFIKTRLHHHYYFSPFQVMQDDLSFLLVLYEVQNVREQLI